MTITLEQLEARLAELEARAGAVPLAAVPPITIGELADVPAPGSPIASAWAQEISNRVVQRFATKAALDTWAAANGSRAFTVDTGLLWTRVAGAWVPKGVMVAARTAADQALGPDGAFITGTFSSIVLNVAGAWSGTVWAAPYAGLVRVAASVGIGIGTTAGGVDSYGDYQASMAVLHQSTTFTMASHNGRFALAGLSGFWTIPVTPGQSISVQVWINGAAGKNKSLKGGIGSMSIEYI